ncbi:tRNA-uridine aminocarboxypropyltransferase [Gallaecimonas xiamenensis]|uniref:tRNA-uridine aminocarboxypropyltransferase n=1 Tax=Gallaecimonas xiamenensis TaxID=1207039 RepID=UPI000A03EE05|nr:tRNA-uridine aminocarboxypropyltransferase [Gallaecimonas xiamenensis]
MARASCPDCRRLTVHCVCCLVTPIVARTAVTLIQFPGEEKHPLGTAALVERSLVNCQLLRTEVVTELQARPGAVVLFPGPGSCCLTELASPPEELVVIDGTWRKALRLYEQSPALQALPKVHLPLADQSRYLLRRSRKTGALSTVEAVMAALAIIEPQLELGPLNQAFEGLIARALDRLPAEVRAQYQ